MKLSKLIILFCTAAALGACKDDSGENPVFGPQEVSIYDNKPAALAATKGVLAEWDMMIAPNDGSVHCRWLLDGVVISTDQNLRYTFNYAGGPFNLRFEATRGGFTNYRQFQLTVTGQ